MTDFVLGLIVGYYITGYAAGLITLVALLWFKPAVKRFLDIDLMWNE